MLPSKGYFHDIECPYYDNQCGRPYCHFRHRKKQEIEEDIKFETNDVPTYKPTPKSELMLNRNHIPISYVPDLAFRPDKPLRTKVTIEKPVYKPTPISVLASTKKTTSVTDDLKKDGESPNEYVPNSDNISDVTYNPTALDDSIISKNLTKNQYVPTSETTNDHKYKPTALSDINNETSKHISDIEYEPSSKTKSKVKENIDFEELDNEFELIDEIIGEEKPSKSSENDKKSVKKSDSIKEHSSSYSSDKKKSEKGRHSSEKSNSKEKKLDKEKTRTREKDSKSKEKKSEKSRSSKDEKTSKSKRSDSSKHKKSSKEHKDDKHKSKKSSSSDKDRRDSKDKKVEKEKSRKKEERRDHKGDKKISSKSNEKLNRIRKISETSENDMKHNKKAKNYDLNRDLFSNSLSDDDFLSNIDEIDQDMDIDNEDETMMECYRIFKEYNNDLENNEIKKPSTKTPDVKEEVEDISSTKKRVAHSNALLSLNKAPTQIKPSTAPNLGQMLANRYKAAKVKQEENEQKYIINEVKIINEQKVSKPNPPFADFVKKYKMERLQQMQAKEQKASTSIIDDILDSKKNKPSVKKLSIAPANNVFNIQRAKAQLEELTKKKAAAQMINKTISQTSKGKREAHVPGYSLNNIPDVLESAKSKLPVNVRTRFLTTIAEECCKLYLVQADAFKRAINEEYSCYQKCKVLSTYKNSAMVAVSKIRKEIKERENQGLGLLESLESTVSTKRTDLEKNNFYNTIKRWVLNEDELILHGYPRESKIPGKAVIQNKKQSVITLPKNQRKCCRCSKIYLVDDKGKVLYKEECIYHPLKKRTLRGEQSYLCCKSSDDMGCVTSHTHVSEMPEDISLEGYQTTLPPERDDDPRSFAVFALDCEMCYTTKGLELTRITIVDADCKTVYESLVKPLNEIIDYNTRFSGITKEQMDRTSTGILQVQANILHLCNCNTILIGHSLESDMKALKIIHGKIIDTSVLFPHKMGLPHKRALRALASEYLQKIIQNDINGHDSAEDAIACMQLIHWKVKEDIKYKGHK